MKSVSYAYPYSNKYRSEFHLRLRDSLRAHGIEYNYYFASNSGWKRGDIDEISWARDAKIVRFLKSKIIYQRILGQTLRDDLLILQQENAVLSNYVCLIVRKILGKKTAYFGHGRNFQSRNPGGIRERFKRFWIDKVDWWFAYTQRTAEIVAQSGFARERITVFNNTIDTSAISRELAELDTGEHEALRQSIVGGSRNVGVYVGGMYRDKRPEFLIESAQLVRAAVPDFHLLLIGAGEDAHVCEAAAQRHGWVHYFGPKFGAEKTALVALAKVLTMPGLVGLVVLDSFAYGTPMVTTDVPYHSPEIDYVEDGVNGVIVRDKDDPKAYADAVVRVLLDDESRERLKAGAAKALETYTMEAMVQRFAEGVLAALRT